jgi:osmotically-inducible protein OsmY
MISAPTSRLTARPPSRQTLDVRFDAASDDLRRRIANFLHARKAPGSASLELDVHQGTVVIRGRLPSAYAKWLCVECCRRVAGVTAVIDELELVSPLEA